MATDLIKKFPGRVCLGHRASLFSVHMASISVICVLNGKYQGRQCVSLGWRQSGIVAKSICTARSLKALYIFARLVDLLRIIG